MSQEYDCDKPPDEVRTWVFTQRWYLSKAHRKIVNMGLYVALIGLQIELVACFYSGAPIDTCGQGVQSINKARDAAEICMVQR